ncbi:hypothetical protein EDB87DRAFT_1576117 [Lactarius vividus]|nr:hypothetical protein EDB87DRAFT_1576117 [Lactarius vividus]
MASHPSEPVLLSALNLESLDASDEKNRVEEFVASQARYAKARVNEGMAVRTSWGISTPEKEKMRLHRDQPSAGFETPVLQPRAAKAQVELRPRLPSPPRPKASRSPKRDERVKAVSVFVEPVSPKRQKRQSDKSAERQLRVPKSSRKRCHARSDTDEEHVARLADRRERKREKRKIMNPREKPRTTTRKERKDNVTSGPTNKKQKISAGFALMHGFSSANVGKSRLTVEPPPNFGVFNKGRASEKVKVDERKRSKDKGGFPSRIFSEDRFLNPRPVKQPAKQPAKHASGSEHSDTMSSKSTTHESSSLIKSKRSSAVQLRRTPIKIKGTISRRQPSIHVQCENKEMCGSAHRKTGAKLTPRAKPGLSAQSVSWIIEKDSSLPSTSSEIATVSAKSKTETAVLDIRNALWGKVLEDNLLVSKALSPLKTSKDPQTASFLPTMSTTREFTPNLLPENDEPATIGPWESASQLARSVLHPPDPRFTYSKFFPFPHADKSGPAEHTTHLASPEGSKDIGNAHSDSDAIPNLDEPLVHRSVSPDFCGEDQLPRATVLSALANASFVDDTPAFPAERTSVLQTSSLDSVDRALLILDAPGATYFPYRSSQIRGRSIPQQEFDPTSDLELDQYNLEPIDSNYEVPLPLPHPGGSEEIESTSGHPRNPDTPGTLRNTQRRSLAFQGEYRVGELETYSEEAVRCYEDYPSTVFNSPEYANDMVYTLPGSSYERQNEAVLFTTEGDTGYEIDMDSMSGAFEDSDPQPEDDDDCTTTGIHLWDDAAWPQGELTNVQRVEQDVAKRLKGHWFPYKF